MKPIGLIIPTSWEAKPVIREFGFRHTGDFWTGAIAGSPVLLAVCGIGPDHASRAAERLCAAGVRCLLSAGFCGAVVPGLRVGDLLTEGLTSISSLARTPAERDAVHRIAGAKAVDMETQAIVEVGTRRGVPVRALRVISDLYEDDLTALFGTETGFSAWKVVLRMAKPTAWPLLAHIRANSRIAHARLIDALRSHLPALHFPADALHG